MIFHAFHANLGHLDRVAVNAGPGKGAPIGTGKFRGRRVMVSSVSAVRGMPRNTITYAATKAGVATSPKGCGADAPAPGGARRFM